ncbi:adenylate kinase [Nisaea sp.]|uniref:adenylate kinase n=1 Tax=Nisaea sp. TaxID=2024842 RepID=UPI003B5227FF
MINPADLPRGVHVLGASGAGTSTFGRAWAERFGYVHLDTDDFYWMPTEPRFQQKRPIPERVRLLTESIDGTTHWVLTGSLVSWGDPLIERFDLVVFVYTPFDLRMERLIAREEERYGVEALQPGGAHYDDHMAFLDWAASYDAGGPEIRSRRMHEAWMERLPCPVVRVSGTVSTDEQIEQVARFPLG